MPEPQYIADDFSLSSGLDHTNTPIFLISELRDHPLDRNFILDIRKLHRSINPTVQRQGRKKHSSSPYSSTTMYKEGII